MRYADTKQKRVCVPILTSLKVDYLARSLITNEEGYFVMIKVPF